MRRWLGLLLLGEVVIAGPAVTPQPQQPPKVTIRQAEQAIRKAAAERKLVLTDDAWRALAVEVVRQDVSMPVDAPKASTDDRARLLLEPVRSPASGKAINAAEAQAAVTTDKVSQVNASLSGDLASFADAGGRAVPNEVKTLLAGDVKKQTEALSRMGLPVEAIKERNDALLKVVAKELATANTLTPTSYQQASAQIFSRLVNVTITTVPTGATVALDGRALGPGDLAGKPFEPGKSYRLDFTLASYQPAFREFYVTPVPDAQQVTEVLAPLDGSAPSPVATPIPGSSQIPWTLIGVVAAGLVVITVVLARLTR